jgi:hypothetical protein
MALVLHVQASAAARQLPVAELDPPRPRPKTSAAVARRLIGAALKDPSLRDKVAHCAPCALVQ